MPEAPTDNPPYRKWNIYRRKVGRLLAEGNTGRHFLIKDEQIVGLWATHDEAMRAGYARFLGQPFLVHQIQERERILHCGTVWLTPLVVTTPSLRICWPEWKTRRLRRQFHQW